MATPPRLPCLDQLRPPPPLSLLQPRPVTHSLLYFSSLGSRSPACGCCPPPSAAPSPSPLRFPPGPLHGALMNMHEQAQRCYYPRATIFSRFAPPRGVLACSLAPRCPLPPAPPALHQRCRSRRVALISRHASPAALRGRDACFSCAHGRGVAGPTCLHSAEDLLGSTVPRSGLPTILDCAQLDAFCPEPVLPRSCVRRRALR